MGEMVNKILTAQCPLKAAAERVRIAIGWNYPVGAQIDGSTVEDQTVSS
jgi:hypothetical protein